MSFNFDDFLCTDSDVFSPEDVLSNQRGENYVPVEPGASIFVEDVLDDEFTENEEKYAPRRSIFEILEPDYFMEEDLQDGVVASIHQSVKMSLNSFRPSAGSTESLSESSHKNQPQAAKMQQTHRTAEAMKDFAINLSPTTFMVSIYFFIVFISFFLCISIY